MGDQNRDTTPDDLSESALPEVNSDQRSEIEVEEDATEETPLEPTGQSDGNSGTGGEVKNQDDMAQ